MRFILIGRWLLSINYGIFKVILKELWATKPYNDMGIGAAIVALLIIYVKLLNTYK